MLRKREKAIDALNGKNVDGRNLIVNEARPREDGVRRGATLAAVGVVSAATSMAKAALIASADRERPRKY